MFWEKHYLAVLRCGPSAVCVAIYREVDDRNPNNSSVVTFFLSRFMTEAPCRGACVLMSLAEILRCRYRASQRNEEQSGENGVERSEVPGRARGELSPCACWRVHAEILARPVRCIVYAHETFVHASIWAEGVVRSCEVFCLCVFFCPSKWLKRLFGAPCERYGSTTVLVFCASRVGGSTSRSVEGSEGPSSGQRCVVVAELKRATSRHRCIHTFTVFRRVGLGISLAAAFI